MKEQETFYDVVIIGTGMGALCCGYILAMEGKKVILLEKNIQLGGNLQVFSRDKCVFDTGVHYLGGLDEGQSLNQLFKYFGIMKDLRLKRMAEEGYDRVHFFQEDITYNYGIGYENFINILSGHFPEERKAIEKYCEAIQAYSESIPLSRLVNTGGNKILKIDLTLSTKKFIESLTDNLKLRKVLAGTNGLYGGSEKTPFYVHALVLHAQIESSWRCIDGGSQIAKLMSKRIHELGGVIKKRHEMVAAESADGKINAVVLSNGKKIYGRSFISNMHPKVTIDRFGKEHFTQAYVERINSLKNTMSCFTLHLVFHKNTFEYLNYNLFQFNTEEMWTSGDYNAEDWPNFYFFSITPSSANSKYAKGASVIMQMRMEELLPWTDTFNTTVSTNSRGEEYEEFKRVRSEKVIDALEKQFPGIRKKIRSYYSSTPLTMRDYTGTPDGSGYGIEKDCTNPLQTIINSKTSVPNLFLTGQNITLHGIFGVSISALDTCFNFVSKEKLMKDINAAR